MKNSNLLRQFAVITATAILAACAGTGGDNSLAERQLEPADQAAAPESMAKTLNDRDVSAAPGRTRSDPVAPSTAQVSPNLSLEYRKSANESIASRHAIAVTGLAVATQGYCCPTQPVEDLNRENYASYDDNPVKLVSEQPVSTFSIDVDTGSYSNVRRMLTAGQMPPHDAVRVEELINYFSYDYATPDEPGTPFNVITELATTPWNSDTLLLHVGLKGFEVPDRDRPPANLVFLVDVSGSMRSADKLPLLKDALKMLTRHLDERDSVAIAGYAGGAGLILEPTNGADDQRIIDSLDRLTAAGRTNGAAGIHLAYDLAQQGFIDGGINRVILATDGDFNVGTVNFEALVNLVEEKREAGVALTALGFGTGNYNDKLLEQIADAGNGNYAYIDNQREARKVLVEEMSSTLQTIAKDVKIQIEFNPATVAEYRLIGYENRMLRREDFNNDQIDAGEIGAGHTVTALYEITPVGSAAQLNDPLRYGPPAEKVLAATSELALVKLRYKQPDADQSQLIERVVRREHVTSMGRDFQFAAAVSAFGQRLRGGKYLHDFDLDQIAHYAADARGRDQHGYRSEFIELVERARSLTAATAQTTGPEHRHHVAN